MADLKGPGALVHQWCPNVVGTWRYYFDGETTPRLTVSRKEIEAGGWAGLREPYAYVASRGWNCYLPVPYARSLKITVDDTDGEPERMYYRFGHRTYPAGTEVRSFTRADLADLPTARSEAIVRPPAPRAATLESRGSLTLLDAKGPGQVVLLRLKLDPAPTPSVGWLSSVVLEGEFDGEKCLSVPLPDLFGSPPFPTPYRTAVCARRGRPRAGAGCAAPCSPGAARATGARRRRRSS